VLALWLLLAVPFPFIGIGAMVAHRQDKEALKILLCGVLAGVCFNLAVF
jgi:hypothetical protein